MNECICSVLCLYCKTVLKLKVPTPDFSKGNVPKVQSSVGECSSRGKFLEAKVQGCISNIPHKFYHNMPRNFLYCLQTDLPHQKHKSFGYVLITRYAKS